MRRGLAGNGLSAWHRVITARVKPRPPHYTADFNKLILKAIFGAPGAHAHSVPPNSWLWPDGYGHQQQYVRQRMRPMHQNQMYPMNADSR